MTTLDAVLGLQWGDEGKGKLIDAVAAEYDAVARFGGGANAGHTIRVGDQKYVFHLIPSAALHGRPLCVIGQGCVLSLDDIVSELDSLAAAGISLDGRLVVDSRTTLLFPYHKFLDGKKEEEKGDNKVGTTKRGIGPAYTERAAREAFRVADLYEADFAEQYRARLVGVARQGYGEDVDAEVARALELAERVRPFVRDAGALLRGMLAEGKRVLAEGGQAAMLDVFHGTYPFVTSSITTAGGICSGLGVPPQTVGRVIGVVKAYTTRVGAGPFPTELNDELGESIRATGHEYGATTGRPRRTGWLDIPVVRYGAALNGVTDINLTKLDVLTGLPELRIAVGYEGYEGMPVTAREMGSVRVVYETLPGWTEDITACKTFAELPENARKYIARIEELVGLPVSSVGVGADRTALCYP